MRPKRYPFSGAKKESETKKISLMLKKVDESDLKGSVWAEPLHRFKKLYDRRADERILSR